MSLRLIWIVVSILSISKPSISEKFVIKEDTPLQLSSKYDGFLIYNNFSEAYVLLKTHAGVHFLLNGEPERCYHPKAYRTTSSYKDYHVSVDSIRNSLLVVSHKGYLFHHNLEPGRYNSLFGERTQKLFVTGPIEWIDEVMYMHYSDKYVGIFNLMQNGWIMFWDHMNDIFNPMEAQPISNNPVTHSNRFINATDFHVTAFIDRPDIAMVAHAHGIDYCNVVDGSMVNYLRIEGDFLAISSNQDGDVFIAIKEYADQPFGKALVAWYVTVSRGADEILVPAYDSDSPVFLHKTWENSVFMAMASSNNFLVVAAKFEYYYIFSAYQKKDRWSLVRNFSCSITSTDNIDSRRMFDFDFDEMFLIDPKRKFNYEKFKLQIDDRQEYRNFEIRDPKKVLREIGDKILIMIIVTGMAVLSLLFAKNREPL